jgi:exodeoxyribonuclease V beta subunit
MRFAKHCVHEKFLVSIYLTDRMCTPHQKRWTSGAYYVRSQHQDKPEWVRAAIGSSVWALTLDEVVANTQDELQWEAQLDNFHQWRHMWQQQGVLPMLHHWLHSQKVASRLLAQEDGERRISNVLHLGELLQHAAQSCKANML